MKKNIFIVSLVILLGISVQAQNNVNAGAAGTTVAAPDAGNAILTFDKEEHDFGTIEYAGKGSYEFKFKNTGTDPLIIADAKGSCGCTVPTYPKDVPIMPGGTQFIKVTYDTKRVGNFMKTVTIYSNTKKHVDVLTIKGTVLAQVVEEAFPTKGKENGATPFESH